MSSLLVRRDMVYASPVSLDQVEDERGYVITLPKVLVDTSAQSLMSQSLRRNAGHGDQAWELWVHGGRDDTR